MACSQKKTIAEYCEAEENKEVVGCKAIEDSIPTKPSSGCPKGTKPSGDNDKHCCCEGLDNCCWHKCPLEGTLENLKKLTSCGIEGGQDKWSYAKLSTNGNEGAFVAQGVVLEDPGTVTMVSMPAEGNTEKSSSGITTPFANAIGLLIAIYITLVNNI